MDTKLKFNNIFRAVILNIEKLYEDPPDELIKALKESQLYLMQCQDELNVNFVLKIINDKLTKLDSPTDLPYSICYLIWMYKIIWQRICTEFPLHQQNPNLRPRYTFFFLTKEEDDKLREYIKEDTRIRTVDFLNTVAYRRNLIRLKYNWKKPKKWTLPGM